MPPGAQEAFGAGEWAVKNWGGLPPPGEVEGGKWPFEPVKASPSLDIWAFGIVVYEVCSGATQRSILLLANPLAFPLCCLSLCLWRFVSGVSDMRIDAWRPLAAASASRSW